MPRSNVTRSTRSPRSRDSGYHSMLTRSGASLLRNWPYASSILHSARTARRIADSVAGTPMGRSTRDRFAYVARRMGTGRKGPSVSPTPVARAVGSGYKKSVSWTAKEGKYKGKFGKAMRKGYKDFKKYAREGVVVKQERGSVWEANVRESIYIGHAIAYETFLTTMVMAVIKYLAKKCINYSIVNWNDTVRNSLLANNPIATNIYIFYRVQKKANTDTFNLYDMAFNIDGTWRELAISFKGNLRTNIQQNAGADPAGEYKFLTMGMSFFQTNAGTFDWQGTICPEQLFFEVKVRSGIVIQNRTKDASGTNNTDVINSNPIVGKRYQNKSKWLNGFEPIRSKLSSLGTYIPLYSFKESGVIVTDSTQFCNDLTKKPPPAYMIGATKETDVLLNPGDIKSGKLKFHIRKIGFNTLFQKMYNGFQDPNAAAQLTRVELGFAEMFGFETQLNDRQNVDAKIAVSWELNQQYSMRVFGKIPSSVPFVDVSV